MRTPFKRSLLYTVEMREFNVRIAAVFIWQMAKAYKFYNIICDVLIPPYNIFI